MRSKDNRTPLEEILYNDKLQVTTVMVEATFQKGFTSEQVDWHSLMMGPAANYMSIEAEARKSLRLGKKTWKLKSTRILWTTRGW